MTHTREPEALASMSETPLYRPRQKYKPRNWPLRLMAAAFALTLAGLLGWAYLRQSAPAYVASPVPELPPVAAAPVGASAPKQTVAASPATQIYLPNGDKKLVISTPVLPLDRCRTIIDPPRKGKAFGGVYGCTDFDQPASASPDLTVIAGHSSKDVDTAFNRLYVQGDNLVGQEVYLKTKASGDRWLTYRINAVHVPKKTDLPYREDIWGAPGKPTPGRLVIVTCRQQPGVTPAVLNYIAVAQLVGVR